MSGELLSRMVLAAPIIPVVEQHSAPTRSRDQGGEAEEEENGSTVHHSAGWCFSGRVASQ